MTTLPQTTTVRLPRPQSAGTMTVGAPTTVHAPPTSFQMTGSDVWRVIRSNMWLIIGLFVFSCVAGYGLNRYLAAKHARYTATGFVQIQPIVPFDPKEAIQPELNNQILTIEQKTHANLLTHESLIGRLFENPNKRIRETTWFKQFIGPKGPNIAAAKEDLLENLSVRPITESKLVAISMSYKVREDTRTIVEDVVNQHLEEQRKLNTDKQFDRSQRLRHMKTSYEIQLGDIATQQRRRAQALSLEGSTPGRLSAKDTELAELIRRQFEIQKEAQEAKATYEQIVSQAQQGIESPKVEELVNRDTDVAMFKHTLNNIDMQLAQLGNLGPDHRTVTSLRNQREAAEKKLTQAQESVRASANAAIIEEVTLQKNRTEAALNDIGERIKGVKGELGDLTYKMSEYLSERDKEAALRELVEDIDEQLANIAQMNNATEMSGVAWAQQPTTPDRPSFPHLPTTLTVCALAGLSLALGIAFIRELTDKSIRSPRDIARVGQLNLLGTIPHEGDDPQAAGVPLATVIFQAPHSMLAEQFRQVRSRLQHAASLDSTRTILVTSPGPGDGKSTVACNLAAGLALNGRRILLVDSTFRRPELHKIFGLPNDQGFAAVLQARADLAELLGHHRVG